MTSEVSFSLIILSVTSPSPPPVPSLSSRERRSSLSDSLHQTGRLAYGRTNNSPLAVLCSNLEALRPQAALVRCTGPVVFSFVSKLSLFHCLRSAF
ncbi:hypothetical protein ARMGADRAFT_319658 [Armillaria gallica]|uniref:Uncharacterized protein n=1 Tax=Armillaria gallica TaxID=47427 RepID=A0A2H3D3K6_ARMGA|nr:hypothetical protein ARMGADRAFT_319658 [Armillaria gallica]